MYMQEWLHGDACTCSCRYFAQTQKCTQWYTMTITVIKRNRACLWLVNAIKTYLGAQNYNVIIFTADCGNLAWLADTKLFLQVSYGWPKCTKSYRGSIIPWSYWCCVTLLFAVLQLSMQVWRKQLYPILSLFTDRGQASNTHCGFSFISYLLIPLVLKSVANLNRSGQLSVGVKLLSHMV